MLAKSLKITCSTTGEICPQTKKKTRIPCKRFAFLQQLLCCLLRSWLTNNPTQLFNLVFFHTKRKHYHICHLKLCSGLQKKITAKLTPDVVGINSADAGPRYHPVPWGWRKRSLNDGKDLGIHSLSCSSFQRLTMEYFWLILFPLCTLLQCQMHWTAVFLTKNFVESLTANGEKTLLALSRNKTPVNKVLCARKFVKHRAFLSQLCFAETHWSTEED